MSWKKIGIIAGIIVAVLAIAAFSYFGKNKNVVTVTTAKVGKQDLAAIVTASGEIRPKTFVNVGANSYGKIVKLYVREGEKVKRGDLLAQLENIQPAADVAAQRATLEANTTDAAAAEAGTRTAVAELNRARADAARAKQDWDRAEGLFNSQLISKADYDTRRAAWEVAEAQVAQAQARVNQTKAQKDSALGRIAQARATLTRASDQLSKTSYAAPFDGVVTNLPVREGENVVVGIQNSPGSTLMTIADMSIITAEVKVDETDIVNVQLDQPAEITIDAIPGKTFKGRVTEIGNNAVIRSSGLATSQTTTGTQEAKDFKVVITLQDPPENLRPGLSTTAKITTGTRKDVLAVPIQALTIRDAQDLEDEKKGDKKKDNAPVQASKKPKEELQGVFVIRERKAEFVKVDTGLTGTTDIEVTGGLKEGDEIVTGSYKVLRTLKNGSGIKVDNTSGRKEDEKS